MAKTHGKVSQSGMTPGQALQLASLLPQQLPEMSWKQAQFLIDHPAVAGEVMRGLAKRPLLGNVFSSKVTGGKEDLGLIMGELLTACRIKFLSRGLDELFRECKVAAETKKVGGNNVFTAWSKTVELTGKSDPVSGNEIFTAIKYWGGRPCTLEEVLLNLVHIADAARKGHMTTSSLNTAVVDDVGKQFVLFPSVEDGSVVFAATLLLDQPMYRPNEYWICMRPAP